jgi:Domain of unknown function (DUF4157)
MAEFEDRGARDGGTAGPFAPSLNRALSASFGDESLSGLSVTRGADAATSALGAHATTTGSHIALSSSVTEDPGDPRSMEIIAHEVAHALAGGGSGETMVDEPGDAGEVAADRAGGAFRDYAEGMMREPPPRLAPAHGGRAAVHRFQIEGPWDVNQPVHETLTAETLQAAGAIPAGTTYDDPKAWEYTRGVMWNDDPQSELFDDSKTGDTDDYSSGLEWTYDFKGDESAAAGGKQFGVGDPMLARSHFGDLQSLHAMAGKDGEDPAVTKQKIMMWAELTTTIAEGKIGGDAKISELAMTNPQFKKLLGDDPTMAGKDVNQLFGIQGKGDVKARATGSLLHMIQDSYADGHIEREDLGDGRKGDIVNFHSYANQDHDKHGAADALPAGPGTDAEKVHSMPGGQDAIDQGAAVVKMIKAGVPPEKVLSYLDQNTFKTAADIGPASAGEAFSKPTATSAPAPAPTASPAPPPAPTAAPPTTPTAAPDEPGLLERAGGFIADEASAFWNWAF